MRIMFSPLGTLKWVAIYALCGAVPGAVLWFAPPERLGGTIELNGETMTVGQVVSWFPIVMFGAAGVTLVVAIVFGILHTIAAAIQSSFIFTMQGIRSPGLITRVLANGMEWIYSTFRLLSAFAGAGLVLFGVAMIWRNIAAGTLSADIDRILILIAAGTGLATGAAFYKD